MFVINKNCYKINRTIKIIYVNYSETSIIRINKKPFQSIKDSFNIIENFFYI